MNRLCDSKFNNILEIINNCSKNKIIKITTKSIDGSYGSIFFGILKNGVNVAIKIIQNKKNKIEDIHAEVDFYEFMDKNNIGPKIYDVFYTTKDFNIYTQYIIMERGDNSLDNVLISEKYTVEQKKKIIVNMINIIKKQFLKVRLYCLDIKPDNFIFFKKGLKVRAIDFGKKFCDLNVLPSVFNKFKNKDKLFTMLMLLQIFMIIHNFHSRPVPYLTPFLKDNIFKLLFKDINFTKQLIYEIIKNHSSKVFHIGYIFKYYINYSNKDISDEETVNYIFNTLDMYNSIR